MPPASDLLPGRLLRNRPPRVVEDFRGVQIDDERLANVLSADAPLLKLHEGTIHAEGPAWQATMSGSFGPTYLIGGCSAGIPMAMSRS